MQKQTTLKQNSINFYFLQLLLTLETNKQRDRTHLKSIQFIFIHPITDRSYSDIQQVPRRHYNNNSPSPRRRPFMGTPTRV